MATAIVETSGRPMEIPLVELPRQELLALARAGEPAALTLLLTGGVPTWADRLSRRMRHGT